MRYAVLAFGEEWRRLGHYASRGRAFETALRLAQMAAHSGWRAEILYTDAGGELHALQVPVLRRPVELPCDSATVTMLQPMAIAVPIVPEGRVA